MVNGVFVFSGGTTGTWTPPTAAAMYDQLVAQGVTPAVGSGFSFIISNGNSGTLSYATSTGVTYTTSAATTAAGTSAFRVWRFTNVTDPAAPTAVIYG